jgi:hypothetical protein
LCTPGRAVRCAGGRPRVREAQGRRRAALRRPPARAGRGLFPGRQHERRVLRQRPLRGARRLAAAGAEAAHEAAAAGPLGRARPRRPLGPIETAKTISFHALGDTGAAKVNHFQSAKKAIENEASVADAIAADVARGGPRAPASFFHLGDVVYHFGEAQYYYDQSYEPFRGYDRPIFAIPRQPRRDGVRRRPVDAEDPPLLAFPRNFCASKPGPSPDAGTLVRSTMTQPGVYFTLDAPFVSIVGL